MNDEGRDGVLSLDETEMWKVVESPLKTSRLPPFIIWLRQLRMRAASTWMRTHPSITAVRLNYSRWFPPMRVAFIRMRTHPVTTGDSLSSWTVDDLAIERLQLFIGCGRIWLDADASPVHSCPDWTLTGCGRTHLDAGRIQCLFMLILLLTLSRFQISSPIFELRLVFFIILCSLWISLQSSSIQLNQTPFTINYLSWLID